MTWYDGFLPNGINWIASSNNYFIAARTNALYISNDGIHWTIPFQNTSGLNNGINWVASNGNDYQWVAVGYDNSGFTIDYSTQGLGWLYNGNFQGVTGATGNTGPTGPPGQIETGPYIPQEADAMGLNQGALFLDTTTSDLYILGTGPQFNLPVSNSLYEGNFVTYGTGTWLALGNTGNTGTTIQSSTDGRNWISGTGTLLTNGGNYAIYDSYNNIWIATGQNQGNTGPNIIYSYNAINWQGATGDYFNNGICIETDGAGNYVATGNNQNNSPINVVLYSNDGINWHGATGTNTEQGTSVVYNGSIWLLGGIAFNYAYQTLYYSTNGQSWTQCNEPFALATSSIVYASNLGKWVATGADGYPCTSSYIGNSIKYSTDGINWLNCNNTFDLYGYLVKYNQNLGENGIFVAIGDDNNYPQKYSYDGVNWLNGNGLFNMNNLAISNNLFMVVGNGSQSTYISNDGINWTTPFGLTGLNDGTSWAASDGNNWVIVGSDGAGKTLEYSTPGESWLYLETLRVVGPTGANGPTYLSGNYIPQQNDANGIVNGSTFLDLTTHNMYILESGPEFYNADRYTNGIQVGINVAYGNGLWVMVGVNGNTTLQISKTGRDWIYGLGYVFEDVGIFVKYFDDNIWLAAGIGFNTMIYSYDGFTWSGATGGFNEVGIRIASDGGGNYVAVGIDSGYNNIQYSNGGTSWLTVVYADTMFDQGYCITYGNGIWVAGGKSNTNNYNTLYYSTAPGGIWTLCNNTFSQVAVNVVYASGFGLFIAVGFDNNNNTIKYSSDGINWNNAKNAFINNNTYYNWNSPIAYSPDIGINGTAVIFSYDVNGNNQKYSYDGINWLNGDGLIDVNDVVYSSSPFTSGIFMATGKYGNIMSDDGIHWTQPFIGTGSTGEMGTQGYKVAYDDSGNWVSVGEDVYNDIIDYSRPGQSWYFLQNTVGPTGLPGTQIVSGNYVPSESDAIGLPLKSLFLDTTSSDMYVLGTGPSFNYANSSNKLDIGNFVTYGTGTWLVVGNPISTGLFIQSSHDGNNWVGSTGAIFNQSGYFALYDSYSNIWLAGGQDSVGNSIIYSTDAINWSSVTGTTFNDECFCIATDGAGNYVAAGYDTGHVSILYSLASNDNTWDIPSGTFFSNNGNGNWVVYGATGTFVVGGYDGNNTGNTIYYSTNAGQTWTLATNGFTNHVNYMIYGDGLFIATGADYPSLHSIKYSSDGITWYNANNQFNNEAYAIGYNSNLGIYVVGGINYPSNGVFQKYSYDGINWYDGFLASDINCIATSPNYFIAARYNALYISNDGIHWTIPFQNTYGLSQDIYWVANSGNDYEWVAVGSDEYNRSIDYSTVGESWLFLENIKGQSGQNGSTTTLTTSNSDVHITSPTSFTISSGASGVYVQTIEHFDSTTQGLYLQFTISALNSSGITLGLYGVSYEAILYYFNLNSNGTTDFGSDAGASTSGTWSVGDTFSIYADTHTVHFYKNSIELLQAAQNPPDILYFYADSNGSITSLANFTNVRFYPTGAIGPTGPTGASNTPSSYTGGTGTTIVSGAIPGDLICTTNIAVGSTGYVWGNALINVINNDSSTHDLLLYMQIAGETGPYMINSLVPDSGYTLQTQYRLINQIGPTGAVSISVYGFSDLNNVINVTSSSIFGLANLN